MTIAAFAWAMKLKNVSPLAKLAAVGIANDYDCGDGRDAGREITALADFCGAERDEILAAIAELGDSRQMEYSIRSNFLTVVLPLTQRKWEETPREDATPCDIYVIAAQTRVKIGISTNVRMRLGQLRGWAPEDLHLSWKANEAPPQTDEVYQLAGVV
jgi:hypothetical protein